jgi:hypothetical protein
MPQKKEKGSLVRKRLPQLPSKSVLAAALIVQKPHLEKLGFGLSPDLAIIDNLNLNMMLKVEF